MKLFQKWRIRKHRQEIKERIEEYNTALTSLSEAAAELLKIAESCNISTEALRQTVEQMKEIAEKAAITPEGCREEEQSIMGKSKSELELQNIIQTAVTAAFEVANQNIEEKLQKAVELGTKIGATVGAEVGAKAAVKAVEREKKRVRERLYDRRYHNTKLLLQNYRHLNEHFKNAIFEIEQAEEFDETFYDIMECMNSRGYDDEIYVEGIKQSTIRTKIIITHVNRMLDIYEIMCERSSREDDKRHCRILRAMYIDETPTTAQAIADREKIDKRTVYRDIDAATACLTSLLYGADGLDKMK